MHEGPPTTPPPDGDDAVVELTPRLEDLLDATTAAAEPEAEPGGEPGPTPAGPGDDEQARSPELRHHADTVVAEVDGRKVGEARLVVVGMGTGVRVYVHPAWRRRGLGLRLLRAAAGEAAARGVGELDIRLDAQDLAGLRLVLASGMCGSISCDGGETRTRLVLSPHEAVQGLGA